MEIKDLILLMWRNVRYILVGLILGAGIGAVLSVIQTPVYEASTKIFVSRSRQQGNSDLLSALSDEQLLAINLQLVKSQSVLNEVSNQLGSKVDADNIQAGAIPNTLIIQIKVNDNDPKRAAAVANLIVQTLIQQNEILLSDRYTGFENAINEQLGQVQKQIESLQTQISQINDAGIQEQLTQIDQQIAQLKVEISRLETEISGFPYTPSPLERITLGEKQAQLDQAHSLMTLYQQIQTNLTYVGKPGPNGSGLENPQLATLQSTLGIFQQINITLINNRESVRLARAQSRQNVTQIVSAALPKKPVRPLPVLYLLLGSVVGLALASTAILMIDHFDDSLKSAGQIETLLGLPVYGVVLESMPIKNGLVTLLDPLSAGAESFRSLGANLEVVGAKKNIRSLMIVNAESTDGRTSIAANLAVINAQQGKKVILIDGDLKHPYLHTLFEMENQKGFAELLGGWIDVKSALHSIKDIGELKLICSGASEKNSTVWLGFTKWESLLLELHAQADLIIVDSPPSNAADTQILISKMDAVFLTVQAGQTRVDSAQAALRRFQLIGVSAAGVILNRQNPSEKMENKFMAWFKKIKLKISQLAKLAGF